jgi:hypothetical protein
MGLERIAQSAEETRKPNETEMDLAMNVLDRLPSDEGFPPRLFLWICERTNATAYELVVGRVNPEGGLEVLLTERPDKDPVWPGELHCPGTMALKDQSLAAAHNRLLNNELPEANIKALYSVKTDIIPTRRGQEHAAVYLAYVDYNPDDPYTFHPVDNLPENTIDHHRDHVIPWAVDFHKSLQESSN